MLYNLMTLTLSVMAEMISNPETVKREVNSVVFISFLGQMPRGNSRLS